MAIHTEPNHTKKARIMSETWFVILVMIALKPTLHGESKYEAGDIIKTSIMASAESKENCLKGGQILVDILNQAGGDSVKVILVCEPLPKMLEETIK